MLILGEQQLQAMSMKDLVRHVRAIESEEEVFYRHNAETLASMTRKVLVRRALELQSEIARLRALQKRSP